MSSDPEELVPRAKLAKEFGVNTRTIIRWQKFPAFQPTRINGRNYYSRGLIEAAKKLGIPREAK
jgi:DNA-binding transcriptional MerR regulator